LNFFYVWFSREILLLVNLSVALANAHITLLPSTLDETRLSSNVETNSLVASITNTSKKHVKGDQPVAPISNAPPVVPVVVVKNDDFRTALEVK
jgi:hypothetical protein